MPARGINEEKRRERGHYFIGVPVVWVIFEYAFMSFFVTGPGLPSAMMRPSIFVMGAISAAVPVRKHSSATYRSRVAEVLVADGSRAAEIEHRGAGDAVEVLDDRRRDHPTAADDEQVLARALDRVPRRPKHDRLAPPYPIACHLARMLFR